MEGTFQQHLIGILAAQHNTGWISARDVFGNESRVFTKEGWVFMNERGRDSDRERERERFVRFVRGKEIGRGGEGGE